MRRGTQDIRGDQAILSESTAGELDADVGTTLPVAFPGGQTVDLEVVGIFEDTPITGGVTMPISVLEGAGLRRNDSTLSINVAEGADVDERPLRVAHLTTVDSSLWYLLRPQLAAVRDLGGDSVGISAPGPDAERLEAEGIRHVPLTSSTRSMNPLADLLAAAELWRILRRERPDVLHTHNPKPGLYGRVVGRLARVPIVVNTCHGLYYGPDDPLLKRTILLAHHGQLCACATVEEAAVLSLFIERAARLQLLAMAAGTGSPRT